MKSLVIVAHPRLSKSIANQYIVKTLEENITDLEVRDIQALYPDYKINVEAEQEALLAADTIIFQYPFYWYNMPAILKQWFDEVFSFNFAYGPEGDKLKGKNFLVSITVGGPADSYKPLGYNHFTVEQLSRPLEQTAYLAKMNFLTPIYQNGMVYIPGVYNTREGVEERAALQVKAITDTLNTLDGGQDETLIHNFVKDWFAHFDVFAELGYFTKHIDRNAKFKFPEGDFTGHEGFSNWYEAIQKKIKPNNDHFVERVDIKKSNDRFHITLTVILNGEARSGAALNIHAKENWEIEITADNLVKIHRYEVTIAD